MPSSNASMSPSSRLIPKRDCAATGTALIVSNPLGQMPVSVVETFSRSTAI
uniref:Uncharacterized protein n=1 Tax=uncultured marine virus TaxID=186617 RepID=A0A0F7L1W3_9VIRU|nr:hypothetical protein [uncultured marine virus]